MKATPGLWRRAGGLRGVGLALLVVVALRFIQLGLVALLAGPGEKVADRLLIWDGGWFLNVASDGYPSGYTYDVSGTMLGNGFAFFPLFPALIRAVAALGIPIADASLAVSATSGLLAGVLIYLLGVALWSRRVGLILTMLVCAQPMAVSLTMGYTEGLLLALAAGTLLAAHQRIWWAAGVLGVCSALTRPTGIAVGLALAVAVWLRWRSGRVVIAEPSPAFLSAGVVTMPTSVTAPVRVPLSRRELWSAVAATVASLAAGPLFLAWVGWRVGEWNAWFKVQTAGWGSTFDWGESVALFLYDTLRQGTGMVEMVTAWLIIGTIALCLVAAFSRTWPPLLTFGLVALVMALGQAGYWHSKPRLLVPVLVIACVPLAHALAKANARTAAALLVLWSGFGLWFGAYMITVWPYTI